MDILYTILISLQFFIAATIFFLSAGSKNAWFMMCMYWLVVMVKNYIDLNGYLDRRK